MGRKNKFIPLPVDDPTHPNTSPFRISERAYKRKPNTPSPLAHIQSPESSNLPSLPEFISNRLIDPRTCLEAPDSSTLVKVIQIPKLDPTYFSSSGSNDSETIPAMTFPETHPGLIFIPSAMSPETQRDIIKKCCREWTGRPNVTNLDTHYVVEESGGVWAVYEREWKERERGGDVDTVVERRVELGGMEAYTDDEEDEEEGGGSSKTKKVKAEDVKACSRCCSENSTGTNLKTLIKSGCGKEDDEEPVVVDLDAFKVAASKAVSLEKELAPPVPPNIDPPTTGTPLLQPLPVSQLIKKWRWSSLGWQYNWTKKKYHMDRPVQFPPELDEMTRAVIQSVEGLTGYTKEQYKSEAGIVNFYQLPDALMGHQDRSEVNMDAPLVSFSLGHSCVFVIGTENRQDKDPLPISLILRSGDIIVMSGASRRVFHGVPRIISNSLPDHLTNYSGDEDWGVFKAFLSTARININVRQIV
ncbi:UNVERIFIED_CONTAM: hypothetical protein HDU68_011029 [Siphonaria sp. JEL0065]|nr:hypothetical protein HDU68_011029 [Siphonaria sp. JEL0065]